MAEIKKTFVMQDFLAGVQTNVTATESAHIPNLGQIQSLIAGNLSIKEAVATESGANFDISTGGLPVMDNYQLVENDRVLLHSQTDPIENGIYIAKSGAWVRATDADESSELAPFTQVSVLNGDHAGRVYKLTNTTAPTVGTDAQTWVVTSASSSAALDTTVDNSNFNRLTGSNAQEVFDATDDAIEVITNTVDSVVGAGAGAGNLGAFDGTIIDDSSSIKEALQSLESAAESNSVIYDNSGVEFGDVDLVNDSWVQLTHNLNKSYPSAIKVYDNQTGIDITSEVLVRTDDMNKISVYQQSGSTISAAVAVRK